MLEPYRERLAALRDDYAAIYADVMPQLDAIRESIKETLDEVEQTLGDAREDIEAQVRDDYPVPVAAVATVSDTHALFSTARSYFENLIAYKLHMGKRHPGTSRNDGD